MSKDKKQENLKEEIKQDKVVTASGAKKDDLKQKIEGFKEQYGTVYEIAADVGFEEEADEMLFVFKKPGRAALSRYIKGAMNDAYRAMYNLVFDCLLYPDRDLLMNMLEDKPGLIVALGNELQELVGVNQNFTSKRL
jgi:hypothetical protein